MGPELKDMKITFLRYSTVEPRLSDSIIRKKKEKKFSYPADSNSQSPFRSIFWLL